MELYSLGSRCWFPDPEHGWILAILSNISSQQYTFKHNTKEININISTDPLPPLENPPILEAVDDLADLSYLHEPAVLSTIKRRYNRENIYTYSGIVLIAMNPFQRVPLYSPETMREYSGKRRGELEPHLFAVAEEAYRNMAKHGKTQSIIVSGESGAGKTQSAKYIMRYFATIAEIDRDSLSITDSDSDGSHANIEDAVLSTNPIMEAFGNAKTTRNDNSSRFGKYIEIKFSRDPKNSTVKITGALIRTYLLERSRLIFQPAKERNYHIFYQLCAGAPAAEYKDLFLDSWENFFYLKQGGTGVIQGVDDAKEFAITQKSLSVIGISVSTQWDIFKICSAVLQIGNIQIKANRDEAFISDDDPALIRATTLLGVDTATFKKWIVKKQIITRSEKIVTSLNANQATVGRDSVAKFIYSMLFDWIVKIVNAKLDRPADPSVECFIGVLDIYGFEHFKKNSFEQFCINYANEKLQQEFNRHVFKLEQEEYVSEEINWSFIDFEDNQPCIDMIENKMGILDLLDEESRLPSGADSSLITKLYQRFSVPTQKFFEKPRFGQNSFVVKHYALDVNYEIDGFIEKNKDTVADEQLILLNSSSFEFLNTITKIEDTPKIESKTGRGGASKKPTLGSIFKSSLISLMETINKTDVHYIRCIKPNEAKVAFMFEPVMVLGQLRACGVLETIRISCAGYPSRYVFSEFVSRYYLLVHSKNWSQNPKELTVAIVSGIIKSEDKYQIGKSKVFFRAGQLAFLENLRTQRLRECVIIIQKNMKRYCLRQNFIRMRRAAVKIQACTRGWIAWTAYQHQRRTSAVLKIQKNVRRWLARKHFIAVQKATIQIQCFFRAVKAKKTVMEIRYMKSVVIIQSLVRGFLSRKGQRSYIRKIVLVQSLYRRRLAMRVLKQLKIESRSVGKLKETNYKLENKLIELSQSVQSKNKENIELSEKLLHIESLVSGYKEKISKLELNLKNSSSGATTESAELKKQVASLQDSTSSLTKQNEKTLQSLKNKELEVANLSSEIKLLKVENQKLKDRPLVETNLENDTISTKALKKEVASLREQISSLLNGKYKADQISESRKAEMESFTKNRVQQVFSVKSSNPPQFSDDKLDLLPSPDHHPGMDSVNSAISFPEELVDRSVRMLTAPEVLDEIIDSLVLNLRIPLPSTQTVASEKEIRFPSHLLGFLVFKQLSANVMSHMITEMTVVSKEIFDFTNRFEDDYVSAFWLSNCHELLCIFTSALSNDVGINGKSQAALFSRNSDTIGSLQKIKTEFENLLNRIYIGWLKELKKRLANMIVPAVIENQSLPGYICKQSGGIWGSWARSTSSVTLTIDQLVNFLSKLSSTMKCYYLDEKICQQILTELIRIIGINAFNHLILRKNFCTWKRGVQIQYNVSRLEEFCTNQGIAEATLHLQQLLQAAKLLTLNKASPQDIETIFDVCFLLNPTQIKKLLSVYYAADFDSPLSGDLLKIVSTRAMLNEKSDNLTLNLDVGNDSIKSVMHVVNQMETFIPEWISLPYLQAILSSTIHD